MITRLFLLSILVSFTIFPQQHWQKLKDVFNVKNIVRVDTNRIFVACRDEVFVTSDYGITWDQLNFDDPEIGGNFTMIVTPDSGIIFFASEPGVYRSKDGGKNFDKLDSALVGVYSMVVSDTGIIYASGSTGTFFSTDNGNNWTHFSDINSIETDGLLTTPDGKLFVADVTGGLLRFSGPGTVSDTLLIEGNTHLSVDAMTISRVTGSIFIGINNIWDTGSTAFIYRSTDGGDSWDLLKNGLQIIDYLFTGSTGTLYAGASTVYKSEDDGLNWEEISGGLSDNQIQVIAEINGNIFAGNRGFGIYRLVDITSADKSVPGADYNFKLFQNYPNPFNPKTKIKYSIPPGTVNSQLAILNIYNVLGKKVTTIVNESQPAGEYLVEFDASDLASGIYFYRFSSGNFSKVKRMLLLK